MAYGSGSKVQCLSKKEIIDHFRQTSPPPGNWRNSSALIVGGKELHVLVFSLPGIILEISFGVVLDNYTRRYSGRKQQVILLGEN